MAEGARKVLGADVGLSVTGVAGPAEQDGQPVGTVFFGSRSDGERRRAPSPPPRRPRPGPPVRRHLAARPASAAACSSASGGRCAADSPARSWPPADVMAAVASAVASRRCQALRWTTRTSGTSRFGSWMARWTTATSGCAALRPAVRRAVDGRRRPGHAVASGAAVLPRSGGRPRARRTSVVGGHGRRGRPSARGPPFHGHLTLARARDRRGVDLRPLLRCGAGGAWPVDARSRSSPSELARRGGAPATGSSPGSCSVGPGSRLVSRAHGPRSIALARPGARSPPAALRTAVLVAARKWR